MEFSIHDNLITYKVYRSDSNKLFMYLIYKKLFASILINPINNRTNPLIRAEYIKYQKICEN